MLHENTFHHVVIFPNVVFLPSETLVQIGKGCLLCVVDIADAVLKEATAIAPQSHACQQYETGAFRHASSRLDILQYKREVSAGPRHLKGSRLELS